MIKVVVNNNTIYSQLLYQIDKVYFVTLENKEEKKVEYRFILCTGLKTYYTPI